MFVGNESLAKFIENLKTIFPKICNETLDEVAECLRRGYKFECIVMDLEAVIACQEPIIIPGEYRGYQGGAMKYLIERAKEKYFGKPAKCSSFAEGFKRGMEVGMQFKKLDVEFKKIMRG